MLAPLEGVAQKFTVFRKSTSRTFFLGGFLYCKLLLRKQTTFRIHFEATKKSNQTNVWLDFCVVGIR